MDPMPPSNLTAMSSAELFGVGLQRYLGSPALPMQAAVLRSRTTENPRKARIAVPVASPGAPRMRESRYLAGNLQRYLALTHE
jgi:hypothetical protein